jgi:hypothetical protein
MIGDVNDVNELNRTILDIGLNVVNENKEARDKLLGI